ncbi:hypothetical protein JAAARDRAFT_235479 [Jaapia argillacea MUCL 33604]|uniref:Protein kinase domain-containing protein n=1 Tax=Jaapia argillacea MUCL 33604 TaxID=933084 RepID=A0A067QCA3_9AGAM|nr:hypothetical protein JAAARDRAFT_235479 [Jaapia argillacea MUCL 33604]
MNSVSASIAYSFDPFLDSMWRADGGQPALQEQLNSETDALDQARKTMKQLIRDHRERQRDLVTRFNAKLDTSDNMNPNMRLDEKKVTRQMGTARAISGSLDLLQGMYLDQVVDLKRLRPVCDRPHAPSLIRFIRGAELWAKVWKVDGGEYIVPFYGFTCSEKSLPILVSPYFENGNAIDFVDAHPDVDHRALIMDIAKGLTVLHMMQPQPIAHGGLRGMNVKILVTGRSTIRALLSDFGLSKLMSDLCEEPVSMMSRVGEYPRWFAPS